ncbi:hypothetical protein L7F22_007769 [Adiantum nelumboides]|nr:hypothetical protein [Adiantum nelumboides]
MNEGIPDKLSLISCLREVNGRSGLGAGKRLHACIVHSQVKTDVAVATALIGMYGRCGHVDEAFRLFEQMTQRTVITWNAMIALSVRLGYNDHAQHLFHQMLIEGLITSTATFVSTLQTVSGAAKLDDGLRLHARIIASILDSDLIVSNALLTMYSKFGRVEEAQKVFDGMAQYSIVSWTILITCYSQQGNWFSTFQIFVDMQTSGALPNSFTFVSLLSVCRSERALAQGKWVHHHVVCQYVKPDIIILNALLQMYCECDSLEDACTLLESMDACDTISWTTIIATHYHHNFSFQAWQLFRGMQDRGVFLDKIGFLRIFHAISYSEAVAEGKQIHTCFLNSGFGQDPLVGSVLVNMYGKFGLAETAWCSFKRMPHQTLVAWNTMISVFAEQGEAMMVLRLFLQMQEEGIVPDKASFVCTLDLCISQLSTLEGKRMHTRIFSSGFEMDSTLRTGLLFMYGKDGNLEEAQSVFCPSSEGDAVSWNAMIGVLSHHGKVEDAIQLFHQMQLFGAAPNRITFMSILLACGHCGLVDLGWNFFCSMNAVWGIQPDVEHLNCMVDLLGRAGCLEEALILIQRMGSCTNAATWTTISEGCKRHKHINKSVDAARRALELEPMDAGMYILMSNICNTRSFV